MKIYSFYFYVAIWLIMFQSNFIISLTIYEVDKFERIKNLDTLKNF